MALLVDTQIKNNLYATGSIRAGGGFTGSLQGTASFSNSASYSVSSSYTVSSSYSLSSSYTLSASNASSSSYALSSSFSQTASLANTSITASYSISASYGLSASNAFTSSYSLSSSYVISGSFSSQANTASWMNSRNVYMDRVDNSTYFSAQHMQDIFHSAGWTTGGDFITSSVSGSFMVTSGTGLIRANNLTSASIYWFNWNSASYTMSLADSNKEIFVYVNYNSGNPVVVTSSVDPFVSDFQTNVALGNIYYISSSGLVSRFHINTTVKDLVSDHAKQMIRFNRGVMPYARESGGTVGDVGQRTFQIAAGTFWEGLNRFSTNAFNSSGSGRFDYFWRSGSTWYVTSSNQQLDNTQYNDVTTGSLVNVTPTRYKVDWIFLAVDSDVSVVYGTAQYNTLALAQASVLPSTLPPELNTDSFLIGRAIIQQGATESLEVDSIFISVFQTALPTEHSSLLGLTTGDDHTQYLLLAGRSGGQTAAGGAANGESLTLKGTNVGSGSIVLNPAGGLVIIGPTASLMATGSLYGTSSFSISSSWAPSNNLSSYLSSSWTGSNTSQFSGTSSFSISSSRATSAESADSATNASNIVVGTISLNAEYYPVIVAANGTTNVLIDSTNDIHYNPSTNRLTVPNISGTTISASQFTGSLAGSNISGAVATASFATTAMSSSYATTSSLSISSSWAPSNDLSTYLSSSTFTTWASGSTSRFSGTSSFALSSSNGVSASYSVSSSYSLSSSWSPPVTGSVLGTSSFSISSSNALTASYIGTGTDKYVPIWTNSRLSPTSSIYDSGSGVGIKTILLGSDAFRVNLSTSTSTSTTQSAISASIITQDGTNYSGIYSAIRGESVGIGSSINDLRAGTFRTTLLGNGGGLTSSAVYGIKILAQNSSSAGELLNLYGGYIDVGSISGSTVLTENAYGLFIKAIASPPTGAIGNQYGIYQEGGSDKNFFSGYVGIGTTNPTSASLTVNGDIWAKNITASLLLGTASNAISSSYSLSSSLSISSSYSLFADTTDFALDSRTSLSASYALSTSLSVSSSYSLFADTTDFALDSRTSLSASYALSASWAPNAVSASYALSASYSVSSSYAVTASYVSGAFSIVGTSSYALFASTASQAISASYLSGSYAYLNNQLIMPNALTTDTALQVGTLGIQPFGMGNVFIGENIFFNGNFKRRVGGTAGLFYFAGQEGQFRFYPSGSAGTLATAPVQFKVNGDTNTVGLGGAMSNNQGVYTNGVLLVSGSGLVGINKIVPTASLDVVGNIVATAGVTASLQGTSSWATNAVSSSFSTSASYSVSSSKTISSSYAVSSSYVNDPSIANASTILSGAASTTVFDQVTGSFRSAFYDYVIFIDTRSRAGRIFGTWYLTSTSYTESVVSTPDRILVTMSLAISANKIQLVGQNNEVAEVSIQSQAHYI